MQHSPRDGSFVFFNSDRKEFEQLTSIEVADFGHWGLRCERGHLSPRKLAARYHRARNRCGVTSCRSGKKLQPLILEDDIPLVDSRAAVLQRTWWHDTTQPRLSKSHPTLTHLGSSEAAGDRHLFNEVYTGPTAILEVVLEPWALVHPNILVEPTRGRHGHAIFAEWFKDADVIRYINGQEAPGSMSLAVKPSALKV